MLYLILFRFLKHIGENKIRKNNFAHVAPTSVIYAKINLMSLTEAKVSQLQEKAKLIRQSVLDMLIHAGSGHTAGSLDMADIFAYLYFYSIKHDTKNPAWQYRDRVVLSNGHIYPVLYATLAHAGYYEIDKLKTLRKFGAEIDKLRDSNRDDDSFDFREQKIAAMHQQLNMFDLV